jgi:hypothetical protein
MDVRACRQGNLDQVFPDLVSENWPKPIVANFVDTVARDLAEITAPLPTFNCSSATMASDAARRFADKRTKIVNNYVQHCKLDVQMLTGADHYYSYGRSVFYIEPDFEARLPRIVIEDPLGGYPEFDRWGRITSYTKRWYGDTEVLAENWPEYYDQIMKCAKDHGGSGSVEIIRYCDKDQISLVVAGGVPLALVDVENRLGEVPVVIAHKSWLDLREPKGQFDDVIWVQLARDVLAKLQLEATEKAVQAPLALPTDVQEITTGPDAILRSATPEKIRRVGLELSPAGFTQQQFMAEEMRRGARYPEARGGNMDASIITGRGVQALMGGFDSQVKAAQTAFRDAFVDALSLCFKMDQKLWPGTTKNVKGQAAGIPYDFAYTPSKDIKGDYSVDCIYGFATGMDPNRAIVMLLQLRAEKAISRDNFMRQLPLDLNVTEETSKVDVEETREAIKQGIFAYVQAIPAMAQQGMDPADAVAKLSQIVTGLKKGKPIEEVVAAAFAPQPPKGPPPGVPAAEAEEVPGAEGEPGGPGGGGGLQGGLTPSGLMHGVPPGQAGQAPGGRPDLSVMLSGLTGSGNPQMSAFTMRRRRV